VGPLVTYLDYLHKQGDVLHLGLNELAQGEEERHGGRSGAQ